MYDNIPLFDSLVGINISSAILSGSNFLEANKYIENPWDIVLYKIRAKSAVLVKFRSGRSYLIDSDESYMKMFKSRLFFEELFSFYNNKIPGFSLKIYDSFVEFHYDKKRVKMMYDSPYQLANTSGMIYENFVHEQYNKLDVSGKKVVDIGANVGDSAIYFALRKSKKVYAFEPYPYSYNLAIKNIKANGMDGKVEVFNMGVGSEGTLIVDGQSHFGDEMLKPSRNGKKIRMIDLSSIIKLIGNEKAVLKIDCEGSEYDILLNSSTGSLKRFDQVIVETHFGYDNIVRKMRTAGFAVAYKTGTIYDLSKRLKGLDFKVGSSNKNSTDDIFGREVYKNLILFTKEHN